MSHPLKDANRLSGITVTRIGIAGRPTLRHTKPGLEPAGFEIAVGAETEIDGERLGVLLGGVAGIFGTHLVGTDLDVIVVLVGIPIAGGAVAGVGGSIRHKIARGRSCLSFAQLKESVVRRDRRCYTDGHQ